MTCGTFTAVELSPGRWRVTNARTEISHVTYGTEAEIAESLERQSRAWDRRCGPKVKRVRQGRSGQWRGKSASQKSA